MKTPHAGLLVAICIATLLIGGTVHAQELYDQAGTRINAFSSSTGALDPGWYYTETGSPRYYYANGVYYDPSTQSYGGDVLYPHVTGPQSLSGTFTPGVPNTGAGPAVYAWLGLIFSAAVAVVGANYLTRKSS